MSLTAVLRMQVLLAVPIDYHLKTLSFSLALQVKREEVIERHVMAIAAKDDHQVLVDDAAVTVARVGSDATHAALALLTERHIESKRVVGAASEAKIVFLPLELSHEFEAGVGVCDKETALHVSRRGRVELHLFPHLLAFLLVFVLLALRLLGHSIVLADAGQARVFPSL